jgi:membrane protease YdiL (CAAX protease family)
MPASTPTSDVRPRDEIRVFIAFVYCALVLTVLEFWFLSSRVLAGGWLRDVAPRDRELWACLTWAGATIVAFLVIPALIVRFGHRERLSSVGFGFAGMRRHLPVYLLLFAAMVPVLFLASRRPEFLATYPFVKLAASDRGVLLLWEAVYVLQFFALESFFRGYLLFTTAKVLPRAAIAIVAAPYTMIHFHKPFPECLGALGAGLILGWLALRYRSFWGGVVLHALVAVSMDLLAVWRA